MSRTSKIVGIVAVVFLAVGLLWHPVVEPQIVRFPAGLTRTYHYQGSIVVFADQTTGAPLAQPLTLPLQIDRRLVGTDTGAHVALVKETDTITAGPITQTVENVFAIDRRNFKNVADPKAYTFTPANVVDRSGTYRLTYPMGVKSKGARYQIFKPETGTAYTAVDASPSTGTVSGTHVVFLNAQLANTPVALYEQAALAARGFPTELTPQQLAAQLKALGIDLNQVTAQLARILSPSEMSILAGALASPVPLQYLSGFRGSVAVEPRTGQIVRVAGVVDGIYVQPNLRALAPVLGVLTAHAGDPTVASLLTTFSRVSAAPAQPVYELRYSQTPASVAGAASDARSRARQLRLATVILPRGLIGLGVLTLVVGGLLAWRRRQPGVVHGMAPSPQATGRHAA